MALHMPSNPDTPKAISQHPLCGSSHSEVHTKVCTIKAISAGPLLRMMEVSWGQRH